MCHQGTAAMFTEAWEAHARAPDGADGLVETVLGHLVSALIELLASGKAWALSPECKQNCC